MTTNIKYQKAVEFLKSLNNIPAINYSENSNTPNRNFYIKRLEYLLKLIGNPHKDMKYIHVTGTAGKGTNTLAIHNVLKSAGYRVGSYSSPHTTTPIERMKVNNKYISPNSFANIVESLKNPLTECALNSPYGTPSYFEVFLAIAFIYFKQMKCDWVVLEAHVGGLCDPTNIITGTKFAVITNIDYDHQDLLGNTLKEIAADKVGILKPGCTFITTETRPSILKMFKEKCEKLNSKFIVLKPKNNIEKNSIIAKKIGELIGISKKNIDKALSEIKLPCRFETIQCAPRVIIDGAHNRIKLRKLVEDLKTIKYKKLIFLFGMVYDKEILESLKEIVGIADHIVFTRSLNLIGARKTTPLKYFRDILKKLKAKKGASYFLDQWQALDYALSITESHDCLVITGSMYLTGSLREKWIDENYILKNRASF